MILVMFLLLLRGGLAQEGVIPVASFMMSRLSKGHYFVDGNKRTAYFTGRYVLLRNGFDVNGTSAVQASEEMVRLAELDHESSERHAREVVERDIVEVGWRIPSYEAFERMILKSIAVSNRLSDS